jgi:hypothetical protein
VVEACGDIRTLHFEARVGHHIREKGSGLGKQGAMGWGQRRHWTGI